MSILPGDNINAWERINDIANICSIVLGLLTTASAIILYQSGSKIQTLKDNRSDKFRIESDVKIAQANSNSQEAIKKSKELELQNLILQKELEERKAEANSQSQKVSKIGIELAEAKTSQAIAEKELLAMQDRFRPRVLSTLQKDGLKQFARRYSGNEIHIRFSPTTPETRVFAEEIATVFTENGWNVDLRALISVNDLGVGAGIAILVHDVESAPSYAKELQDVLAKVGLGGNAIISDYCQPGKLILNVSTKE